MDGSPFDVPAKALSGVRSRRTALAALVAVSISLTEVMAKRTKTKGRRNKKQTADITVGGVPLAVELADQPAETSRGLGYRAGLAPGTGMLFLYAKPAPQSFWMKGMQFCIDIIWIEYGVIQGAAESVCPEPAGTADADLTSYLSSVPVSYVLEVPAGWLYTNGLSVGAQVEGLPTLESQ